MLQKTIPNGRDRAPQSQVNIINWSAKTLHTPVSKGKEIGYTQVGADYMAWKAPSRCDLMSLKSISKLQDGQPLREPAGMTTNRKESWNLSCDDINQKKPRITREKLPCTMNCDDFKGSKPSILHKQLARHQSLEVKDINNRRQMKQWASVERHYDSNFSADIEGSQPNAWKFKQRTSHNLQTKDI